VPAEKPGQAPAVFGRHDPVARLHDPAVRARRQGGATHRYPGGRPAITSFHKLASSLRPALSLRRQGVEPRRPLPFAGRVRLLLHDIPAPPAMD
jgi:hypothetical protein